MGGGGADGAGAGAGDAAGAVPQANKGWPSKKLPANTRFFVIKSFCARDLKISMQRSLWATQQKNESTLNQAFESSEAVVLFFSVNESRGFQGYARMASKTGEAEGQEEGEPLWTGSDGGQANWGSVFQVKWQTIYDLPFDQVRPPPPAHPSLRTHAPLGGLTGDAPSE